MRLLRATFLLALGALAGFSVTLQQLSLEEMIGKSTAIVRARVMSSYGAFRGPMIYTHYRIQVLERWKGPELAEMEIVVPGGVAEGMRQTFGGAPRLADGGEYVLFLWKGSSGLTNIIGLSQGVLEVKKDGAGATIAWRAATTEAMLDAAGRPVKDAAVQMKLQQLREHTVATLARSARR